MPAQHTQIPKQEALDVLNELDILPFLGKLGDAKIVGSVALDLIVKPDIDIHIIVEDLPHTVEKVYRYLNSHENISKVKIKDFGTDVGVLVGVDEYKTNERTWSIDIWITTDIQNTGFLSLEKLSKDMTPEYRKRILEIKSMYCNQYGGTSGGLSPKIYQAVVYDGVENVQNFQEWLKTNK